MKHIPRKRFGQHFLTDKTVIGNIIGAAHFKNDDTVIEIGPGLGALTQDLVKILNHLHVVEIDDDLAERLTKTNYAGKITIHHMDVLNFDIASVSSPDKPCRIIGNLPYQISTPLIFHLLKRSECIHDLHIMLQKEVVDRLIAKPNTKEYGRLSVMCQYYCRIEKLFNVSSRAFNPPPKVVSSIARLIPHKTTPLNDKERMYFSEIVRTAFSARRKTIKNALGTIVTEDMIRKAGLDLLLRPENLTVSDYTTLSKIVVNPES